MDLLREGLVPRIWRYAYQTTHKETLQVGRNNCCHEMHTENLAV